MRKTAFVVLVILTLAFSGLVVWSYHRGVSIGLHRFSRGTDEWQLHSLAIADGFFSFSKYRDEYVPPHSELRKRGTILLDTRSEGWFAMRGDREASAWTLWPPWRRAEFHIADWRLDQDDQEHGTIRGYVIVVACWPLMLAAWSLVFAGGFLLRRRRKPGFCTKCNYDLRASQKRCPECGTPILVEK